MLLVICAPGLTGWSYLPGEGPLSHCQLPSAVSGSLCRAEALWAFLIQFAMFIGVLVLLASGQSRW